MRLAFVDDDYGEIKKLTTMIDKELHGTVYSSCTKQLFSTGETFLSVWKPGMYDIVFLDIFMDQLTGVDVARQIRKTDASVKIIFCTTSNEFASESISPFSFLISCCKGIIVNLYEVINKENNCFILSDNSTIPISRRKIKEINNVYADFIFEKMKDKMLNDEAN